MSVTVSTTPETKALLIARRAAAKELRMPVTDWRVRRYALLMVAHDQITARLANGEGVNVDALLKLDGSMQEIRSSIPVEQHTIKFQYVEGVAGIYRCQHCGKQNDLAEGLYTPSVQPVATLSGVEQPREPKPLSTVNSRAVGTIAAAPEQRPYHETHAKDLRPNARPSLANAGGSVVWSGQGKHA